MGASPTQSPRRTFIAALLTVIGSPVIGMCYLGRGRRSLVYLALVVASVPAAFFLATNGVWPAGLEWYWLYLIVVAVGLVDVIRMTRSKQRDFSGPWFSTWQGLVGIAVAYGVFSLGVRSVLIEPFRVPAASMVPTLAVGDYFFASKFAYGVRLPFTSIELTSGEAPARGDVVVFRPESSDVRYVKRIIGVPGDVVAVDSATGELSINGEPMTIERRGRFDANPDFELAQETIDGRSHELLLRSGVGGPGGVYRVPDGRYFVLGDSRGNSLDSRSPQVGFVPEDNIIGRASLVWWNTSQPDRAGLRL